MKQTATAQTRLWAVRDSRLQPLHRLRVVDQTRHRWVSGNIDAAFSVLFRDQVYRTGIRQKLLEQIRRLIHQRHAISQEQHA